MSLRWCETCHAQLHGAYCHVCGERVLPADSDTLTAWLRSLVAAFVGADARLWRTLWRLVARPARLIRDHLRGSRRPYVAPLQLFLLANAVYFFAQPHTTFNAFFNSLQGQAQRQFYSAHIAEVVVDYVQRAEAAGETAAIDGLTDRYNALTRDLARLLVVLYIPLFALGVAVACWTRARGVVSHFAFATYFTAWFLLFMQVLFAFAVLWGRRLWPGPWWDAGWFEWGLSVPVLIWLLFAVRGYGLPWWRVVPAALLLGAWSVAMMIAYRYVLFWITWWSL